MVFATGNIFETLRQFPDGLSVEAIWTRAVCHLQLEENLAAQRKIVEKKARYKWSMLPSLSDHHSVHFRLPWKVFLFCWYFTVKFKIYPFSWRATHTILEFHTKYESLYVWKCDCVKYFWKDIKSTTYLKTCVATMPSNIIRCHLKIIVQAKVMCLLNRQRMPKMFMK